MRDFTRRQMAQAKSRRATPEELREARERLKEIDAELAQMELAPETTKGEERELRYERILRLRAMRDDFVRQYPIEEPRRLNGVVLAVVMTVASFLLCVFCAGGVYGAYSLVNQKPDPTATADAFWTSMEQQDYAGVHENYLSPNLRFEQAQQQFVVQARQADDNYGNVTNYTLISKSGDMTQTETLTYSVTRGNKATYKVVLVLTQHSGVWGVNDLGAALNPQSAGLPAPSPTAQPSPTASDTPTQ